MAPHNHEHEHKKTKRILCFSFSQDQGCFAVGTKIGYKIFNTQPLQEKISRGSKHLFNVQLILIEFGVSIVQIEMMYRSNILALVGYVEYPKENELFLKNRLVLWDDSQQKEIGQVTYKSEIKGIRLRPNRIVTILEGKIFVHNFSNLQIIDTIDIYKDLKGLCSLNLEGDQTILACSDAFAGFVNLKFYDEKKQKKLKAHESAMGFIQLNKKGDKLATASEKGQKIRIFDTETCEMLQQFRRGDEFATIWQLCFDYNDEFLTCSSDTGTMHIYQLNIKDQTQTKRRANPQSYLSFLGKWIPYFQGELSFASIKLDDIQMKVVFGEEQDTIVIVSQDANYYIAKYDDIYGGKCKLQETVKNFMNF